MPTRSYEDDGIPTRAQAADGLDTAGPPARSYIGQLFKDRYLIDKELGRGGIGIVYLARDQQLLSKAVVVKVLLEETGEDSWFRKKFLQEMEALARLDHPGIVGVIDSGLTPDGKLFLVMQFIKGENLRSQIRHEGMSLEEAAGIIRQCGRALTAAHEQQVIHCDLKPENIMVQNLGPGEQHVKIVDFGVAKVANSKVESADKTRVSGTPAYMAPEQLMGRPSASSDIYALGVIAYEMLTGRRPFNAPVYQALDAIRAGVRVKPKDLRPELPEAAQELILKALSYNPADRPEPARDFGESLAQALTASGETLDELPIGRDSEIEMSNVLFMDIVGYSKLPTDSQTAVYKQLQEVVSSTETFRRAKESKGMISRSTGDGMALVFFGGPNLAVNCANEISSSLKRHREIELRIGINSGPVYRVKDMNDSDDVAGSGINMAQRVMDCGDAGHILVSGSVADVLKETAEWRDSLHDIGKHRVKHGVPVHLFNLYSDQFGNPRLPDKLRKKQTRKLTVAAIAVLVMLAIAFGVLQSLRKGSGSDRSSVNEAVDTSWPGSGSSAPASVTEPASAETTRSLRYSLTVQKFHNGKEYQAPHRMSLADTTVFEKGDGVEIDFASEQSGHFYLLNEPPAVGDQPATYIILAAPTSSSPAPLKMDFPKGHWLKLDDKQGAEKLWLVWSAKIIPALEAVKDLNNDQDNGKINDPAQVTAIADFLKPYSSPKATVTANKEGTEKEIKMRGSVLVYPLTLQHYQ